MNDKTVLSLLVVCSLCAMAQAFFTTVPAEAEPEAEVETAVEAAAVVAPPQAGLDMAALMKARAGAKQSGLSCASTTVAGDVYIMLESKDYMFCSASDFYIAKANTAYNVNATQCIWRMRYCTTSGNDVYVHFYHHDSNNLLKFLTCFRAYINGAYQYYCWQLEIDNPMDDLGNFFRMDTTSGGKYLYNPYSYYYAKDDGYQLQLSVSGQTVFRICFKDIDLVYC